MVKRPEGLVIGDFTISELVPEALRQNLSRLVIGEVRGGEAAAMFEAMQAGTGTLSTTHSHSAESTMDRLASRVAQGGVLTVEEAYRQIAHNIHLFIYVKLVDETWKGGTRRRYVSEIRQLTRAIEHGRPVTHLTYHASEPEVSLLDSFPTPTSRPSCCHFVEIFRARCNADQTWSIVVTSILAITAGLLIIGGLLGIVYGLRRQIRPASHEPNQSSNGGQGSLDAPGSRGRQRDLILLLSMIIGCLLAMLTGWLILIVCCRCWRLVCLTC
jgi:hypothetical protein